ncbi:hypothetical protein [Streptomyces klenkii]|uniref:hypothetical protein n=1 Tax=Streptomyces klenkii TaxID=1420899 RepID=UPI003415902C
MTTFVRGGHEKTTSTLSLDGSLYEGRGDEAVTVLHTRHEPVLLRDTDSAGSSEGFKPVLLDTIWWPDAPDIPDAP